MSVPDHPCTAYCSDTLHVDVVHATDDWSDAEIVTMYRRDYGVTVVKVEPAPEAPPSPEPSDPARTRPARLVWWRS